MTREYVILSKQVYSHMNLLKTLRIQNLLNILINGKTCNT